MEFFTASVSASIMQSDGIGTGLPGIANCKWWAVSSRVEVCGFGLAWFLGDF